MKLRFDWHILFSACVVIGQRSRLQFYNRRLRNQNLSFWDECYWLFCLYRLTFIEPVLKIEANKTSVKRASPYINPRRILMRILHDQDWETKDASSEVYFLNGSVIDTLFAMGLLGTRTYENPSPHPVGSADPVTASWHFPFIAEINARVVFHGAVRT